MGQVDYRTVCTLGDLAPDKREATITKYFERTQTPNLTLRHVERSILELTSFFFNLSTSRIFSLLQSASTYNTKQFKYHT